MSRGAGEASGTATETSESGITGPSVGVGRSSATNSGGVMAVSSVSGSSEASGKTVACSTAAAAAALAVSKAVKTGSSSLSIRAWREGLLTRRLGASGGISSRLTSSRGEAGGAGAEGGRSARPGRASLGLAGAAAASEAVFCCFSSAGAAGLGSPPRFAVKRRSNSASASSAEASGAGATGGTSFVDVSA